MEEWTLTGVVIGQPGTIIVGKFMSLNWKQLMLQK